MWAGNQRGDGRRQCRELRCVYKPENHQVIRGDREEKRRMRTRREKTKNKDRRKEKGDGNDTEETITQGSRRRK